MLRPLGLRAAIIDVTYFIDDEAARLINDVHIDCSRTEAFNDFFKLPSYIFMEPIVLR